MAERGKLKVWCNKYDNLLAENLEENFNVVSFQSVSAYSGHYRPTDENLSIFLAFLQNSGVNLEEVKVKIQYNSSCIQVA